MPLKCCVPQCNSNYDSTDTKVSVFRFPKDEENCKRWIKAIPRANLKVTNYTVVCKKHWPSFAKFKIVRGKECPIDPPSIFHNIPNSCLAFKSAPPRKTKRALSSIRNQHPDEIDQFLEQDKINLLQLEEKLIGKNVVVFKVGQTTMIQSKNYMQRVSQFLVKLSDNYSFETYHFGAVCSISSLAANRIVECKTWSCLDEIITYLSNKSLDHKKEILAENLQSMGTKRVGQKLFSPKTILQAFEYFSTSRALYSKLVKDYALPSIRTLIRITSKVDKFEDVKFLKSVLNELPPEKRHCITLIDEVYVKPSLAYHGGTIFGKAVDQPEKLAKTVCCLMLKCLYGGP